MKIKNPYQETPYQILGDAELGDLPSNASKKEVEARYARLAQKGNASPAVLKALNDLKGSGKRINWDIFCASLEQEQQLLQELINNQKTNFQAPVTNEPSPIWDQELLALGEMPPPPHLTNREVTLTLPLLDDSLQPFRTWLSQVSFEV